jgi:hypothetical protein
VRDSFDDIGGAFTIGFMMLVARWRITTGTSERQPEYQSVHFSGALSTFRVTTNCATCRNTSDNISYTHTLFLLGTGTDFAVELNLTVLRGTVRNGARSRRSCLEA